VCTGAGGKKAEALKTRRLVPFWRRSPAAVSRGAHTPPIAKNKDNFAKQTTKLPLAFLAFFIFYISDGCSHIARCFFSPPFFRRFVRRARL
jgi:hypothetical protein